MKALTSDARPWAPAARTLDVIPLNKNTINDNDENVAMNAQYLTGKKARLNAQMHGDFITILITPLSH